MYSQHEEDEVLAKIFGNWPKPGRFLDIGAADGISCSNTWRLVTERNWGGLMVEPNPPHFAKLQQNLFKLPPAQQAGITPLSVGVSTEHGLVKFWSCGDLVSTAVPGHKKLWEKSLNKETQYQEIYVQMLTVEDILDQFKGPFDLVSIDTEGSSADIFIRMPIKEMAPKVIIVEHDSRLVEIGQVAQSHGYAQMWISGENVIYGRT